MTKEEVKSLIQEAIQKLKGELPVIHIQMHKDFHKDFKEEWRQESSEEEDKE